MSFNLIKQIFILSLARFLPVCLYLSARKSIVKKTGCYERETAYSGVK